VCKIIVYFGGLLAAVAILLAIHGIRSIFTTNISIDRFKSRSYNIDEDSDFAEQESELREIEKMYKINTPKKVLIAIIGAVVFGAIGLSISGKWHIGIVSCLLGLFMPSVFENWHEKGRRKQMEKQFEDAAEQMAIIIKSGGSMQSAIERAASEAKYPLKKELDIMAAQLKLNMPLTDVFRWLANRVSIPEIETLIMVAALQSSGMAVNIAAVLETIQNSIRSRRALREQIAAYTSEGKLSSKVVGAMPFIVIGFIRQVAPQFVEPLFTTAWGMSLVGISVAMIFGGMMWINKMIEMEE